MFPQPFLLWLICKFAGHYIFELFIYGQVLNSWQRQPGFKIKYGTFHNAILTKTSRPLAAKHCDPPLHYFLAMGTFFFCQTWWCSWSKRFDLNIIWPQHIILTVLGETWVLQFVVFFLTTCFKRCRVFCGIKWLSLKLKPQKIIGWLDKR